MEIQESIRLFEIDAHRQVACSIKFWTLVDSDVQKLYGYERYVHRKF